MGMTREEIIDFCNMKAQLEPENEDVFNAIIKALEQEPRKGHWIDKSHSFESCSAECSSCHKRSNGYLHDNGFSLECKYFDFCPKCGSDNREVEPQESEDEEHIDGEEKKEE